MRLKKMGAGFYLEADDAATDAELNEMAEKGTHVKVESGLPVTVCGQASHSSPAGPARNTVETA